MQTTSYRQQNQPYLTFGIQILLIANIAIYLIELFVRIPLRSYFALHANWLEHFAAWQLISYQFVHLGFGHLLANMLGLFFLGPDVERGLGTNRFFILYFLSGVLGGLGWSLISPDWLVCVGASGAVLGVLGAYAALYPNRELFIYGLIPVRAWILIIILGLYELSQTISGGGGIANAAHLSGGIAGYIYATLIGRPDIVRKIRRKVQSQPKQPIDKREINRILDKVADKGLHSLTASERDNLKRAGKQ
jgi:membrane associated rhomboid family serine protease